MDELRPTLGAEAPMQALMRMINGFRVSQAIHVATVLGIADLLRDGPRDVTDLASACDADPEGLYRLLRALSAVGVFEETVDRTFAQSSISEHLRTDSIASAAGWARLIGQEYFWSTWGQLALGIKTGKNVFPQLYDEDVWSYRARDPALSRIFDDAMTSMSSLSSRQVIEAFDFSQFSLIVDIAGGKGRFLTDILTANPDAHGILFDQPHVVTDELLKTAGVADRAKVVGGSFFEPLPPGGDAYILMAIIHDWEDAESNAILNNVREAIAPDGKLLLVERVVEQPNAGPMTKFSDLNMLVLPGGRERTEEEFGRLYEASGFRMERIVRAAPDGMCVVEGIPI